MYDVTAFTGELIKLAYGWGDINKVLAISKERALPKSLRRALKRETGANAYYALSAPPGASPSNPIVRSLAGMGGTGVLTPASGGSGRMLRQVAVSGGGGLVGPSKLSGRAQKALDSVFRGHELDEIATRRKGHTSMAGYGHQSPEVILREHNRVVTLPLDVRGELATTMQAIRGPVEAAEIGSASGGGFQYGQSPRLSRHARRRLTALVEAKHGAWIEQ